MNTVNLIGRLTKEVEVKQTQSGVAYANFTLAVNRPFTNQSGEREADFISCVIWRERAENLAKMTAKGSQIGVTGRIQTRNYDNEQGQRVYITEVVADNFHLIESKEQTAQRRAESGNRGQSTYNYNQAQQPNYGQQQSYTTELPKQGYNQPQQQQQNYNYNQQTDFMQPTNIAESDLPF